MYITKTYTVKEHYKLTKPWGTGLPKVLFLLLGPGLRPGAES